MKNLKNLTNANDKLFAKIAQTMLPLIYSDENHDYMSGNHPSVYIRDDIVYVWAYTQNDEKTNEPVNIVLNLSVNTKEGSCDVCIYGSEFITEDVSSEALFKQIRKLIDFYDEKWKDDTRLK